ncbi:acylamino-acid-releasing enzyme isoform X2 [Exaiptasia diaphana]|uniref:acylaminoacyl-peptidase n=1 Tax=Exaiptasia diaphana TaxID=2652724 RepID=A0A913XNF8_EXADI|nr:acylamino-acid-releasing enzyme isoform X2 [Exaiptasia diaphana]
MSSNETEEYIQNTTKLFKDLCNIPTISKGCLYFTENQQDKGKIDASVTSQWSQRDLVRLENRAFQRNHIVTCDRDPRKLGPVQEPSFPVELQHVQLSSTSPSGKFQAVVKKIPATKKDEEKQYLEIWSCHNMIKCFDIKALDKHGDICEDSQFSSMQWSPSEEQLLYVAEKKKEKSALYFGNTEEDKESSKPPAKKGDKYEYEENWGELLVKRCHPVLVVLNISTDNVTVIDGIPEELSVGQAVWAPEEKGVVFCGWWHVPYRLGLVYCTNRRSGIFYVSLDGSDFEQLSKEGDAVFSPNFNLSMDKLIYLARNEKGVHKSCTELIEIDWKSKTSSVVVDIVQTPEETLFTDNGFPGIFTMGFPTRCWSTDGTKVVLSSFWRSSMKILIVDLPSKSVAHCTKESGCWNVLDVHKDFILASFSSPSQPQRLVMAPIPKHGEAVDWTVIAGQDAIDVKWEIIKLTYDTQDSDKEYEAVLIQPSNGKTKPDIILHAHGGPHSCYPSNFMNEFAVFCRLGYAVLSVNYRGSLGFGQQPLESLISNIGTQDVNEVKFAVDTILKRGEYNRENVFVMGGSHGGFLACHLVGQFPDFFRAMATRNPVVNLLSMLGTSDIPDWIFEESGLYFNPELLTDADTYSKLLECSPISHAKKIITPTLLMLGAVDLRVPPSQGKELYRTLKARGVEVRLLVYPEDSHPLNKVETESDAFVNIARWFYEHRKVQ